MRNTTPPTNRKKACFINARDMAVLRAAICGCQVVLASATPSLESWVNCQAGKYARLDLGARFGVAEMPAMAAIDMRAETLASDRWISRHAGGGGDGAGCGGRAVADLSEPPGLCAGDAVPGLRASGGLR